eukprot:10531099-Ditylum_brightwellii.AAC.1
MIYGTVDGTKGANAEWHKFPIDVVARFEVAAGAACLYYSDGVAFLAQHVVKLRLFRYSRQRNGPAVEHT